MNLFPCCLYAELTLVPSSTPTSAASSAEKMLALVLLDAPGPDLLAIDVEGGRSAFAASAVVGEIELDGRLAWYKLLGGVDRVLVKTHMVVGVRRLAVHHVEAPPAEAAALAEDHAVGALLGISTSAVIVFDWFFTLMKAFSIMPVMPA